MPQVSIIVPVYDVEPYIDPCIKSILAQSFVDFELVLIDDGSPDNCGAICDEYGAVDKRVHVIHQSNRGLSAARNAGLDWVFANSDSAWITFVDSDDLILPEMLNQMMWLMEQNNADISACGFQTFLDKSMLHECNKANEYRVLTGRESCFRLYDNGGVKMTIACAKLYRRCLFESIRFPVGKQHEDEATTYKVLYNAKCVVELAEPFYCYRLNPNSIMNTAFSTKRFDALEALKDRTEFFLQKNDSELAELTRWCYRTTHAKLIVLSRAANRSNEVPPVYRMSEAKALKCLRTELSNDNYTFYLAKLHPHWILPHEYVRKIKKVLHIPCN